MKKMVWFLIVAGLSMSFFAKSMEGSAKQLQEHLKRLLILETQVELMQAFVENKEKEINEKDARAALSPIPYDDESESRPDERLLFAGMLARYALWSHEVFEESQRVRAEANRYYRLPKVTV